MIRGMEALNRAIEKAGGVGKLAALIGLGQSAVSNWIARGQVPEDKCPVIEALTGERCEDLREDVDWTRDESGNVTGYHVRLAA